MPPQRLNLIHPSVSGTRSSRIASPTWTSRRVELAARLGLSDGLFPALLFALPGLLRTEDWVEDWVSESWSKDAGCFQEWNLSFDDDHELVQPRTPCPALPELFEGGANSSDS